MVARHLSNLVFRSRLFFCACRRRSSACHHHHHQFQHRPPILAPPHHTSCPQHRCALKYQDPHHCPPCYSQTRHRDRAQSGTRDNPSNTPVLALCERPAGPRNDPRMRSLLPLPLRLLHDGNLRRTMCRYPTRWVSHLMSLTGSLRRKTRLHCRGRWRRTCWRGWSPRG